MVKIKGGQAVVEALMAENTDYVFGLIGSATMEMFDALYDHDSIRMIGVHDERTGSHMADGYARMSGKTGIVMAGQNGPGATNLVTGLAQAKAAYTPLLSMAGSLSSTHVYRDAFQEVDQQALFTPITKKTWTVTRTDRVVEMMREAFRVANAPRKGPVQLNLPRDILSGETEIDEMLSPHQYRPVSTQAASDEAIQQAVKLLAQAQCPVIMAGGGIKMTEAAEIAMTLAEKMNCPIVTSPGHGDAIPFDFHLNAGQMGPRGNMVASRLVKEADVILALGTRIGFNSTFYSYDNINKDAKIIQIEQEPTAIGRYFPVEIGIWADAPTVASQLCAAFETSEKRRKVDNWCNDFKQERQEYLAERDKKALSDNIPIHPSGLFKMLRETVPHNAAITMDAGTLCLQATDALNYWQPKSLFTPLDFGLVGFSFACGLGCKLAAPERPIISLMGDGGFGMTVSELSTAVDYGINTVTIVLNNGCWGAEKAYQRDFFNGRYIGSDISSPPFDKLAELYGAKGYATSTLAQTSEAIEDALSGSRPAVIDVKMDPTALYSFRRDSFMHRGS
ncbi:MAG: thiamine pyrophosphate-binding protein [Paracoccaceae bacterium]|nr:thiamine pyrophosphate-binding protein [Paracoccaceae bacterium]MDE2916936.1 thiamine pyrophosphate-binding protein [Paracoccaceae bacterium]